MSFLRRIFGRDVKTDTAVQNGYTLVADDTKTSGLDWSDVLIRGGLGRDLSTGLNNINASGYDIDEVGTPGEYFFGPDTAGSKPSTWGLLKVWREHIGVLYQIVQSADKASNRMFSRYYGAGSWGPWTEYANTSSMPSLSGYATETYVNDALPTTAILKGSVSSTSSFGPINTSKGYLRFHIVSPGGGGGGGNATQYAGPGGNAGNSGMVLDMLYQRNIGGPYTIDISIGTAGAGGAVGSNFDPYPQNGQDGGAVEVTIDGIPIIVYGGKGGLRGGTGTTLGPDTRAPTPRSEPTINGNTVYEGGVYTVGSSTFIINSIYHSYSSHTDQLLGIGRDGVSPMTSYTGGGTPVPSPQSAPATAIGTSGAGGISEYGGYTATAGGTGGPGMVILYG